MGLMDRCGEEFDCIYTSCEAAGKSRKTVEAQLLWFRILESQMGLATRTGSTRIIATVNRRSSLQRWLSPARAKCDGEEGPHEEADMYAKTGEGSNATYRFSFDAATSQVGNAVGKLMVTFPSGGSLTNTGFFQGGSTPWRAGALLGKSDEYVWPIPPSPDDGGFVFDHGVSDIVFGDVNVNAQDTFRPEFDENIYSDPRATFNSPQDALRIQLAEESKESSLEFGSWMPDGYYQKGSPTKFRYNPKLKLKDPSADFKRVGMATSDMVSAVLERPSIMDIDALFTAPLSCRSTSVRPGNGHR